MTRPPDTAPIIGEDPAIQVAGHWTRNDALIQDALALYAHPGWSILDLTYGKGNFWNPTTRARYNVVTNDVVTNDVAPADYSFDYRQLPNTWSDAWDAVVFDPPYIVRGGRSTDTTFRPMNNAYGIHQAPHTVEGLAAMNHAGLAEAARVARPRRPVFVKYANGVSGGHRRFQIDDLTRFAVDTLGLTKVDEFIFATRSARKQPARTRADGTKSRQQHGHDNTSRLLVFLTPKTQ